jgi:hypothetical protein
MLNLGMLDRFDIISFLNVNTFFLAILEGNFIPGLRIKSPAADSNPSAAKKESDRVALKCFLMGQDP